MVNSAAGLAALALFVLVLGYWVPLRVRQRQELADARVDDRFSTGLRVLAVAADQPGAPRPDRSRPDRARSAAARSGDPLPVKVPVQREAREETPVAPRPTSSSTPFLTRRELLAARAVRARRRLVLTVVLVLAVLAAGVTVVTTSLPWLVVLGPGIPLVGVLVLGRAASAAARRADARWEAERKAAGRRAVQARALAAGGPRAPINRARVTGRAVHGSSALTQMLPRVAIEVVEGVVDPDTSVGVGGARPSVRTPSGPSGVGAAGSGSGGSGAAEPRGASRTAGESGPHGPASVAAASSGSSRSVPASSAPVSGPDGAAWSGHASAPVPSAPASAPAASARTSTPAASARTSTPASEHGPVETAAARPAAGNGASAAPPRTGEPWEPRPVPLPTYVTKAQAPPREPRTSEATAVSSGWSTSPWQRPQDSVEKVGDANTSWSLGQTQTAALGPTATPASGETSEVDAVATPEPRPVTETLGLPLDQILARRRAAG